MKEKVSDFVSAIVITGFENQHCKRDEDREEENARRGRKLGAEYRDRG